MKITTSYIVLLFYSIQLFHSTGIFINFKINQDYITKVLCINREKPDMECNGQCHLKKEIRKSEKQQEKAPQNLQYKQQVEIITYPTEILNCFRIPSTPLEWAYQHPHHKNRYSKDIFHPPQMS